MSRHTSTVSVVVLSLAAALACSAGAFGQANDIDKGQKGAVSLPPPIKGLGGVRSKAPRGRVRGSLLPQHDHTRAPSTPGTPAPSRPIVVLPGVVDGRPTPVIVTPVPVVPVEQPLPLQPVTTGTSITGSFGNGGSLQVQYAIHAGGIVLPQVRYSRWVPCYPQYGEGYRWWSSTEPMYGTYSALDPALMAAQSALQNKPAPAPAPVRELTPIERADQALNRGDAEEAATVYRAYLKDAPDDTAAMRSLGIALLEMGQLEEGVAMFGLAHQTDPTLARRPMDQRLIGARRLRECLLDVVRFTNKHHQAAGWVTVMALMQAEGRSDVAASLLAKAQRDGLSEPVLGEFRTALGK